MEWYPFYPALYREHTIHLTAEQDGIYRRLIDYYMETRKPLPNNDYALARIAGVEISCFKQSSSILRAFFEEAESTLNHKKCDQLLDEQDQQVRFRTERAKKAANARHCKPKLLCYSNAEAMLKDATITVDNNNNSNKKDKKESIFIGFSEIEKPEKQKINKLTKATRLSPEWDLPQEWGEWADIEHGLSEKEINFQAEKFKDYWLGCGKPKNDWKATWRNWIRNYLERKK